MNEIPDPKPDTRKRDDCLSSDGKWRSFPKVPYLLQYVSSGTYYGRLKINGKIIRESLETDVWSKAKLRLHDFVTKHQVSRGRFQAPLYKEAVEFFKQDLAHDTSIKPQSKQYRIWCIQKLEATWPELLGLRLDEITETDCKEWAAKLQKSVACHYYNNIIGTLKQIIQAGIKSHKEKTGEKLPNPAEELKRTRITQKELQLPDSVQFAKIIEKLRKESGGWGPRTGDLIEFLAYSGMRIASEAAWVAWEDVDWAQKEIIVRGHPDTGTKNSDIRRVPIISNMENLLERMKAKEKELKGPVLKISRCNEALKRVCNDLGIPRLTHHDFRHLFATRCIEANVPIPTVARWLGHKDGGALAMKTYGHLRNEHSQEMAAKVKF